jgi:hypothetical protein
MLSKSAIVSLDRICCWTFRYPNPGGSVPIFRPLARLFGRWELKEFQVKVPFLGAATLKRSESRDALRLSRMPAVLTEGQTPIPPGREIHIPNAVVLELDPGCRYAIDVGFTGDLLQEVVIYSRIEQWERSFSCLSFERHSRHALLNPDMRNCIVTGWHKDGNDNAADPWLLTETSEVTEETNRIIVCFRTRKGSCNVAFSLVAPG